MKLGVLTSSRADFGIYTPLLRDLSVDPAFDIAFGTHLSERHGLTVTEIESKAFGKLHTIKTKVEDSSSSDIAKSYADVATKFASFWDTNTYDLVLCLGDRYEMNAAIQAGIPYNVLFGHFHGGEQTLGAIDNIYRHQITLASKYHFTSTEAYKNRVEELIDVNTDNVFNVGSLSLSGLEKESILDRDNLLKKFNIPSQPYILATFHPETVKLSAICTGNVDCIQIDTRFPSSGRHYAKCGYEWNFV